MCRPCATELLRRAVSSCDLSLVDHVGIGVATRREGQRGGGGIAVCPTHTIETPPPRPRVRASVQLRGFAATGNEFLDRIEASRSMRRRRDAFRRCFRPQGDEPAFSVTVDATIEQQGNVSAVTATADTPTRADVALCVQGVVRRIRLRPTDEGASAAVHFELRYAVVPLD